MFRYFYLVVFLSSSFRGIATAQHVPVGNSLENYYRYQQLTGKKDSAVSFTIRPLIKPATENIDTGAEKMPAYLNHKDAEILPFTWQNQYNTHHAYGWNDASMIPSKGYQTMISGGLYAEYGPLSIQVKPEVVFAQNAPFEEFPEDHYEIIWPWYYNYYNNIDLPVRFGTKAYFVVAPGQSSIRINARLFSLGFSTENLWWGPGIRNSLLMSNSAPGFPHFTFNTRGPVHTSFGSIEGQLILGRLEGSGFTPPDTGYTYMGGKLYVPKRSDWRYISGLVFTYQPKWVPGLFLGFGRTSQMYSKDLKSLGDYLPFFSSFNSYAPDEDINAPDRYTSMFFRWVWKEAQSEVYMEYGRNDQSRSFFDFIKEPDYGRAYIFGLRKLFPLTRKADESILTTLEVTQLSQQSAGIVRNGRGWYVDDNIRHGYTNKGESIGAGIGPGGNLQSLDVSWVKGTKNFGIQLERYVHNNDFFNYAYEPSKDFRRHWVDLSVAVKGEREFKKITLNAKINYIRSLNYGWYLLQTGDKYFINGRDVSNFQIQSGLTYRFN